MDFHIIGYISHILIIKNLVKIPNPLPIINTLSPFSNGSQLIALSLKCENLYFMISKLSDLMGQKLEFDFSSFENLCMQFKNVDKLFPYIAVTNDAFQPLKTNIQIFLLNIQTPRITSQSQIKVPTFY